MKVPVRALSLILFALCPVLAACGKAHVDPELQPYVEDFYAAASRQNVVVPQGAVEVRLDDAMDVSGHCESGVLKGSVVTISTWRWEEADESVRRELVFHELGHCLLNRAHLNDLMPDGITPVSYMHAGTFNLSDRRSADDYERELFHPND